MKSLLSNYQKVLLHVEIFVQNPSLPRTKVFFLFRSDTFRSDPTNIYCAVIVHEAVNPNNKLCNKNINLHFTHQVMFPKSHCINKQQPTIVNPSHSKSSTQMLLNLMAGVLMSPDGSKPLSGATVYTLYSQSNNVWIIENFSNLDFTAYLTCNLQLLYHNRAGGQEQPELILLSTQNLIQV